MCVGIQLRGFMRTCFMCCFFFFDNKYLFKFQLTYIYLQTCGAGRKKRSAEDDNILETVQAQGRITVIGIPIDTGMQLTCRYIIFVFCFFLHYSLPFYN